MADEDKFISSITLPNNEEYPIRDIDAARSSHTHGNIENDGTLTYKNRLVWTTSAGKIFAGDHYASATCVAINDINAPSETFYVNGSAQFNIGSNDGTNQKRFIIQGNGKSVSIGGQGIQAFSTGTTAKKLYIQDWGGDLGIGESHKVGTLTFKSTTANISWDTASVTGNFTFNTSSGFNYAGIESGTTNSARVIWFAHSQRNGTPVYNTNFTYNPATPKLTLGAANITGSTSTTANTDAFSILTLGNDKNKTTTNAHSQGKIVLYSGGTAAYTIVGTDTNTAYILTLPAKTGTLAVTDDITVTSVTATGTAPLTLSAMLSSKKVTITGSVAAATSAAAGIVLLGATGGAATFEHTHDYLSNTNKGSKIKPIYINNNAATECEQILPVYYSNYKAASTTLPGAYTATGTNPATNSGTWYGSALILPGSATNNARYQAQLYIASESGTASPVHAYIRRLTDGSGWSSWSTLLDNKNTYATTSSDVSIGWNTSTTIATINGTAIKIKIPSKPTYSASDVNAIGSVTSTGTAPLTLTTTVSGTAVTITGSIAAASSISAGIIKIGTGASDALAGDTKYAGSDSAGGAANSVKITAHANSNASNNTNYYPWFSTTTSGGLSAQAYASFYLHETVTSSKITKFDVCIGTTNVTGTITLWDGSSHYGNISTTALNGNRTYALPNASGLLALLENGTAKGSDTKPIKVLDTGVIAECSLYAGGTAITLNNISKSATSATIYAPTSNGTLGQVLKANGETNAPTWEKEYSVEIIRMTT